MLKTLFCKIEYNHKILKFISVLMIMAFCLTLSGCGNTKDEETTEAVEEDDSLIDSDGFSAVKDYVITVQDGVNVRKEPEVESEIYITLDAGVTLNRTGVKDGWTRVLINGGVFYLESRYVEQTSVKWATETDVEKVSHVVFIDPAKQITEDLKMEPISPEIDAPEMLGDGNYATATSAQAVGMKTKMSAGAIGRSTGNFEYEVNMSVANYLNAELVKRGYTVYLSRTTNNVDISNAKRAEMANSSGAEIFIRLEAPAANDPTSSGVLGFIATSTNSHTGHLYQKNYELCYDVLKTTCEETGATRMGIYETDKLTALNYCNMPATVISMGFLSNENDDIALSTDEYKKKLAVGIAEGIDLYFQSIEEQ